ncbi:hypothetical protein ACR47K_003341 [Escherichia coli]|uniref:hypothetical protein n=2 Tax=Escherichia coli TaxID=562 RepID=UPI0016B529CE|nr:hypothetical protein [Escherichia coli]EEW5780051.1 hypothetical protein [Escherichia coli]EEZ3571194.1 allantoate permease family MFS transporter [Escherichia coli]EFD5069831.1 allantoate permease family MFS transporter [Escherichia coli]EFK5206809.1 allantoate permease family MFS transporter [Escherichia coli]EFM9600228.1 allantoate permease family MFS transporter [Escherichia coli]
MDNLEEKLSAKKALFISSVRKFLSSKNRDNFIDCMINGTAYFNEAEKMVGNSKLQGKHNDGLWVTDLAESCEAILESYLLHIEFIKSHHEDMMGESYKEPNLHALSSMQRMVKMYCQKESSSHLRERFLKANLPTKGFDVAHRDDIDTANKYITLSIGSVLVIMSFAFAMFMDNPSYFKIFIIRSTFAVGCAALASFVPGWINVNVKGYVKAGGAIAIILIFYFFNPPAMLIG